VQAYVAGSESLRTPAGDSDDCHLGVGYSGPYRPRLRMAPETPALTGQRLWGMSTPTARNLRGV
jgi:hypothetical protein